MKRTDKNNILDSGKTYFKDDKSSGQYSYPEWNKSVIPSVSTVFLWLPPSSALYGLVHLN